MEEWKNEAWAAMFDSDNTDQKKEERIIMNTLPDVSNDIKLAESQIETIIKSLESLFPIVILDISVSGIRTSPSISINYEFLNV